MKDIVGAIQDLKEHWLWQHKPFAKGQAWIDLHMLSAMQQTQMIYKGKVYKLKPYQLITSENDLRIRWDWSRTKLRSFLRLLSEDSMIKLEPDKSKTLITLLKRFDLQDIRQESLQDIRQGEKHLDPLPKLVFGENIKPEKKPVKEQKKSKIKSRTRIKPASDMPKLGFQDA